MADQGREATSVWMLRSAYLERTDTRERILPYGDNPRGVLILHEGGRMAAIITPSAQAGDVPQERGSIQPDVGPGRQPRPEPKSLQAEQGAERTQRWVAPVVVSPLVAPAMSAGAIAVSVPISAWAKTTARVKTAASPHMKAPAHMAAATPTAARERV
jgi:Lipocalin-like domain